MKLVQRSYTNFIQLVLFALIVCSIYSCSKSDSSPITNNQTAADWKVSSTVSGETGSAAITLEGIVNTEWQAEITDGKEWCSFSSNDYTNSTKAGVIKNGLNVLYVYYKPNIGKERNAKITIQIDNCTKKELYLTQIGINQANSPTTAWAEIPELKASSHYQYVTHYGLLNGQKTRNYSICFDKNKKAALWVAYPIHSIYLGSGGRTDAWAFDPIVPESFQPNCIFKSYLGNYDRGHQIPSGDRTSSNEFNAQTFYMSNMTPQFDRLNQDMWAKLEGKIRGYKCSDTLYVVTGCYFGSTATTTSDGVGNSVSIPTNYFKVLLRTKSGSTGKAIKNCSENELISIGFWVDHKSYGNIEPTTNICTSVADIENKTGFKFFPQVSETVKKQNNPSQWGI